MACPSNQPTICPYCRQPVDADEVAATPANEYPTHYFCRLAQQALSEQLDEWDDEREYRGREEDARDDTDE